MPFLAGIRLKNYGKHKNPVSLMPGDGCTYLLAQHTPHPALAQPSGSRGGALAPPAARFPCDQGAGAGPPGPGRGQHVEDGPSPRAASQCASDRIAHVMRINEPHQRSGM